MLRVAQLLVPPLHSKTVSLPAQGPSGSERRTGSLAAHGSNAGPAAALGTRASAQSPQGGVQARRVQFAEANAKPEADASAVGGHADVMRLHVSAAKNAESPGFEADSSAQLQSALAARRAYIEADSDDDEEDFGQDPRDEGAGSQPDAGQAAPNAADQVIELEEADIESANLPRDDPTASHAQQSPSNWMPPPPRIPERRPAPVKANESSVAGVEAQVEPKNQPGARADSTAARAEHSRGIAATNAALVRAEPASASVQLQPQPDDEPPSFGLLPHSRESASSQATAVAANDYLQKLNRGLAASKVAKDFDPASPDYDPQDGEPDPAFGNASGAAARQEDDGLASNRAPTRLEHYAAGRLASQAADMAKKTGRPQEEIYKQLSEERGIKAVPFALPQRPRYQPTALLPKQPTVPPPRLPPRPSASAVPSTVVAAADPTGDARSQQALSEPRPEFGPNADKDRKSLEEHWERNLQEAIKGQSRGPNQGDQRVDERPQHQEQHRQPDAAGGQAQRDQQQPILTLPVLSEQQQPDDAEPMILHSAPRPLAVFRGSGPQSESVEQVGSVPRKSQESQGWRYATTPDRQQSRELASIFRTPGTAAFPERQDIDSVLQTPKRPGKRPGHEGGYHLTAQQRADREAAKEASSELSSVVHSPSSPGFRRPTSDYRTKADALIRQEQAEIIDRARESIKKRARAAQDADVPPPPALDDEFIPGPPEDIPPPPPEDDDIPPPPPEERPEGNPVIRSGAQERARDRRPVGVAEPKVIQSLRSPLSNSISGDPSGNPNLQGVADFLSWDYQPNASSDEAERAAQRRIHRTAQGYVEAVHRGVEVTAPAHHTPEFSKYVAHRAVQMAQALDRYRAVVATERQPVQVREPVPSKVAQRLPRLLRRFVPERERLVTKTHEPDAATQKHVDEALGRSSYALGMYLDSDHFDANALSPQERAGLATALTSMGVDLRHPGIGPKLAQAEARAAARLTPEERVSTAFKTYSGEAAERASADRFDFKNIAKHTIAEKFGNGSVDSVYRSQARMHKAAAGYIATVIQGVELPAGRVTGPAYSKYVAKRAIEMGKALKLYTQTVDREGEPNGGHPVFRSERAIRKAALARPGPHARTKAEVDEARTKSAAALRHFFSSKAFDATALTEQEREDLKAALATMRIDSAAPLIRAKLEEASERHVSGVLPVRRAKVAASRDGILDKDVPAQNFLVALFSPDRDLSIGEALEGLRQNKGDLQAVEDFRQSARVVMKSMTVGRLQALILQLEADASPSMIGVSEQTFEQKVRQAAWEVVRDELRAEARSVDHPQIG